MSKKMMRVIAGSAKGRHIKVPQGTGTRPATDLVRGAIFSILENSDADWSRVLDLFSGSGSLGIEALSRGAGWVDFVDQAPSCCRTIRENLAKTGFADRARVHCLSVARAISLLEGEYSLILIDPPYADSAIGKLLQRLATSRLVGPDTIVVVTHSSRLPLAESYPPLGANKKRRHGDSSITVYRRKEAES
jgi:16S rRNA (guanine966-N2)-methyltransferase